MQGTEFREKLVKCDHGHILEAIPKQFERLSLGRPGRIPSSNHEPLHRETEYVEDARRDLPIIDARLQLVPLIQGLVDGA